MLVEKFGDAIRIARKIDRPNVGVMFNLCHYLKAKGEVRQSARCWRMPAPF